MTQTAESTPASGASDRRMRRTYVFVLVVEAVVLAGLWAFGQYFSR